MKSIDRYPRWWVKFSSWLRHPLNLAIALALFMCLPLLLFLSGTLLYQRLLSTVLYAFLIITLARLSRAGVLLNALFSLGTLLYTFASCCEIGNFLIKGDSFGNEFWLFADTQGLILSFQTAPALASVGLLLPIVTAVGLFAGLRSLDYSRRWKSGGPGLVCALLVAVAGPYINVHYSSAARLLSSYTAFTDMTTEAAEIEYTRDIPNRDQIKAQPGKNILHIILESFGDIYTDDNRFPGLAPNLAGYKQNGLWAANMIQTPNQANSYMGHFVTEFGRYYLIAPPSGEEDIGSGYVLKRAGYTNIFLRGAGPDMAGPFTMLYSPHNGYDSFIASHILESKYDKTFTSGFGYTDEILFQEALALYKKLVEQDKPFKLTLFTLDMHGFPQGISDICKKKYPYTGPFQEDDMVQAVHCTDTLVGEFIDTISRLPGYENLIIVLHADHVQHTITPAVMKDSQKLYSVMMGAGVQPFRQAEETRLMDIAPTMLSLAGIETNAGFFAGDDFSGQITREPVLSQAVEHEVFSNDESLKKFSMIEAPLKEEVDASGLHRFKDDLIEIDFVKLDGAIFSTVWLYMENKQEHSPFYVVYPLTEKGPKRYLPSKGIIPVKGDNNQFTAGISVGITSQWKGALLEDLTSGAQWKIHFSDNRIEAVPSRTSGVGQPIGKKVVFQTNNVNEFKGLDQVKHIGSNRLEVFGGDSRIYFEIPLSKKSPHLVVVNMDSPHEDIAKLYYELNGTSYSEATVSSAFLDQGNNRAHFFLPRGAYRERFRFDIGENAGIFKFSSLTVYALSPRH